MLTFLIIALIIFFSPVLEQWERKAFQNFWSWCFSLVLIFSFLNPVSFQNEQDLQRFENNVVSVLDISRGGTKESDLSNSFIPPTPPRDRDYIDGSTGSMPQDNRPKYPWGADPFYRPPLGGSSGASSGSNNGDGDIGKEEQIPDKTDWISDESVWSSIQESCSSDTEEKEIKSPGKLDSDIDFPYQYDSNGNPTLLIPNTGRLRGKRKYTRVEFDQTASHMHHASDLGIPLPNKFDMEKYMKLDTAGRVQYTKEQVPRDTVIQYQNELGRSLCDIYNINGRTSSVPGFAGKRKVETELKIQQKSDGTNLLGIIREDGLHISSYDLDADGLEKLIANDFWVLKDRDL